MTEYAKRRLDQQLLAFLKKNFEKPQDCRDLIQLDFYIDELTHKINKLQEEFNYVPYEATLWLKQYNSKKEEIELMVFKNSY